MNRTTSWTEGLATSSSLRTQLARRFYFLAALLVVAAVAYGFSQTINQNLFNPSIPRPWILYVHAVIFFGWVGLFIAQTTLIQTRNIRWHRRLGSVGAIIGAAIPVVGLATALAMARFNVLHGIRTPEYAAAFLSVPINDMVAFTTSFALAIRWRNRSDYHRRLMFIATCCLTAAAFARFPFITMDALRFYAGVDAIILLGVVHDVIVTRKVHPVYRYGLPLLILVQAIAMTLFLNRVPFWMSIGRMLID